MTPEVEQIIEATTAAAGEEWREAAERMVEHLALTQAEFNADDLWEAGLERPRESRALGGVMRAARKAGIIEPTGRYVPSRIKGCHSGPKAVWRSLVFVEAVAA